MSDKEESAYTKEEIDERVKKTYDIDKEAYASPTTKHRSSIIPKGTGSSIRRGISSAGMHIRRKIAESQDVDMQIRKTNKKAQLVEAKTRLAKANKRLKQHSPNLGYSLGGPALGNDQLNFEAGFGDALAGKRHIKKAKKKSLYLTTDHLF